MRRAGWVKLGLIGLAMAFCLFFGVTLATQGTERIHGPLTKQTQPAAAAVQTNSTEGGIVKKPAAPKKEQTPKPKPVVEPQEPAADTGINRVGNKVGGLLQIMAYHAIRAVVSLFEMILK